MKIIIPSRSPSRVGTSSDGSSAKRSSADAIRSRLLFKLGIYDPNFLNASIDNKIRCESFAVATTGGSKYTGTNKKMVQQQQPPQVRRTTMMSTSSEDEDEPQDRRSGSSQDRRSGSSQDRSSELSSTTYLIPLKIQQDPQDTFKDNPHLLSSSHSSSSFLSSDGSGSDSFNSEPPLSVDDDASNITPTSSQQPSPYNIQFDPSVTVIPVPSHRSLSSRMHAQLYIPKDEMNLNTARSTREFIYEGWDWNNVIEENGMYICRKSGEFVHPAHVGLQRVVVNPYL